MAVVLDYKSSRKTLSPTKVASGLQLQLLTYAVVLQKGLVEGLEDIRDVLGAFYISTRMESVQQPAIKISRQKKESRMWTEEDMREELEKKKRLTGWIFSENIDLFDDDATHVANLKQAEGKVVGRDKNAIRSLSALGDGLQEILTYLGESILQGAIACEPVSYTHLLQHALGKAVSDEQLQDGRQDQQQNDPEDRLIKVADHTAPFGCRHQAHEI